MHSPLTEAEKREVWGDFTDHEQEYLQEVQIRWGATEA